MGKKKFGKIKQNNVEKNLANYISSHTSVEDNPPALSIFKFSKLFAQELRDINQGPLSDLIESSLEDLKHNTIENLISAKPVETNTKSKSIDENNFENRRSLDNAQVVEYLKRKDRGIGLKLTPSEAEQILGETYADAEGRPIELKIKKLNTKFRTFCSQLHVLDDI